MGRVTLFRNGPRVIDLDILFYGDRDRGCGRPADPAPAHGRPSLCAGTAGRTGAGSRPSRDLHVSGQPDAGGCGYQRGDALVIILAFAGLLLPGLAWWAWLGERREDPLVSLAQMVGVGMAVVILLAGGGFILGVEFSRLTMLLLLVDVCPADHGWAAA
jgi:hypothetical protein